jgi:hypothetical protein
MIRTWTALILTLGVAMTALGWTPSSYGVVLNRLGSEGVGLIWGEPKPIRSDEWAVWTPLVQATVHNDFRRINETSPYKEDLRNINALPLRDWGLVLKPAWWGFGLLDPARAFALSWALPMVAFLLGWERLFRRLGSNPATAIAASGALWFSGYIQTWWTTTGPMLAAWPWVLLAALAPWPAGRRFLAVTWATAVCMLAHFYPPVIWPMAAVAVAVLLLAGADRPRVAVAAAGALGGIVLVAVYLGEFLLVMGSTVYPGDRVSSGGAVTLRQVLDLVLPGLAALRGESFLDEVNVCEAATTGTALTLLAVLSLNRDLLKERLRTKPHLRRGLLALLVTVGVFVAWMLLPLPSWLGGMVGLDRVPPVRLVVPTGVALLLLALQLPSRVPMAYLAASACLWNGVGWADFNPIQDAAPLFDPPRTDMLDALDQLANEDPRGWLVVSGHGGATLNGLGYASVSHVLGMPNVEFFRQALPELPASELDRLFNRVAHIQLSGNSAPELFSQSIVQVPLAAFGPALKSLEVRVEPGFDAILRPAGWIDRIAPGNPVVVTGWGRLDGTGGGSGLVLRSRWPIRTAVAESLLRPDVVRATGDARLVASGFRLEITLDGPTEGPLCIISEDPELGRHLLQRVGDSQACIDLVGRHRR